ncbi:MAG: hypothetical protein CMJ34_13395 [Phycisphaerae bacterium]|nr:hypothetical protein [Phycisphaerae bacterium]
MSLKCLQSTTPPPMEPLLARLRTELRALLADNGPEPTPSVRDLCFILGMVAVATVVVATNHYGVPRLAGILSRSMPPGVLADPRRTFWAGLVAVVYTVPPLIYCRLFVPDVRRSLGLTPTRVRSAVRLWVVFALCAVPLLTMLSTLPGFRSTYPMARGNMADPMSMTVWLLAYGLQFVGLELFFRGFLLLVPRRILGIWGLAVMLLPYAMLHFSKPPLETIGSVGFGLMLGILAFRSRSIVDGIGMHLILAFTLELLALGPALRASLPWSAGG